jgi:hypothetical protein
VFSPFAAYVAGVADKMLLEITSLHAGIVE